MTGKWGISTGCKRLLSLEKWGFGGDFQQKGTFSAIRSGDEVSKPAEGVDIVVVYIFAQGDALARELLYIWVKSEEVGAMKKGYTIREIHTSEGMAAAKFKRIRVYGSIQHIWNEVHFSVCRKNVNLPETYYNEGGVRIIFSEVMEK